MALRTSDMEIMLDCLSFDLRLLITPLVSSSKLLFVTMLWCRTHLDYTGNMTGVIRSRNCLPFTSTWVHPLFVGGTCVDLRVQFSALFVFDRYDITELLLKVALSIIILTPTLTFCLVCPMLPMSMDCPLLTASSVS